MTRDTVTLIALAATLVISTVTYAATDAGLAGITALMSALLLGIIIGQAESRWHE